MLKARRKMAETTQFAFSTAVRGFHVYRTVWTPHGNKKLVIKAKEELEKKIKLSQTKRTVS